MIIVVTTSLYPGGAENNLLSLVTNLKEEGLHVSIVSLKNTNMSLESDFKKRGFTVREGFFSGLYFVLRKRGRIQRLLGWMYHGNLAAFIFKICMVGNVPLFFNVRQTYSGLSNETSLTALAILLNMPLSYLASKVLFNSAKGMNSHQKYLKYSSSNASVVRNEASSLSFRGFKKNRFGRGFNVALVGRDHPMKGFGEALAEIEKCCRAGLVDRVFLGGEVSNRQAYLEKYPFVIALGLLPADVLWGRLHEVCDIVISPSLWGEGMQNVVIESWQVGIPCVVTSCGDAEGMIHKSFRLGDGVQDLGNVIMTLAEKNTLNDDCFLNYCREQFFQNLNLRLTITEILLREDINHA